MACRALLDLHPRLAAESSTPVAKLSEWMIKFQFESERGFFTLDPVSCAPALGANGVAAYRQVGRQESASGYLINYVVAVVDWLGFARDLSETRRRAPRQILGRPTRPARCSIGR